MDIGTLLVLAGMLVAGLVLVLDLAGVAGRWILVLAGAVLLIGAGVLVPA